MKLKTKNVFRCQECAHEEAKWMGKCSACGKWNSYREEEVIPEARRREQKRLVDFSSDITLLTELKSNDVFRTRTGNAEFDRLLGGGMVRGSLVLLGGSPGIGKSTLMLQIAASLSKNSPVLYVTGEESVHQVKNRADRLCLNDGRLYLLAETDLEKIVQAIKKCDPRVVIIDSIQTTHRPDLTGSPGTVGQIRECTAEFLHVAKAGGITIFVLGHVTKEGDIAGPRVLEHMVDTVLYFEEEKQFQYRILRARKNRFGPVNEIGIFEMSNRGLHPVGLVSDVFLSHGTHRNPGTAVVSSLEGSRPLLLEIQALVCRTHFGFPKRQVSGLDYNRVLLLTAVLEKKIGLHLESEDIFVNVAGGLHVKETAIDCGICCAVASASMGFITDPKTVCIGEVGLTGEMRAVPRLEMRLKEAEKMGFTRAIVPASSLRNGVRGFTLKIEEVSLLKDAIDKIKCAGS